VPVPLGAPGSLPAAGGCLVIGEPFASFVIEHHPQRARWITQEEAVQILKEEDERGHAHHAFLRMPCSSLLCDL